MRVPRRRVRSLVAVVGFLLVIPTVSATIASTSAASASSLNGEYRCVKSQLCDVVNVTRHFDNYSSVCSGQNCNFVAAADWEEAVLGVSPLPATIKSEYSSAGQTYSGGLDMPSLWSYWRTIGVDGEVAARITSYPTEWLVAKREVSLLGALIVKVVVPRTESLGALRLGPGEALMVVDGYTPVGPLVVFGAATRQMTWSMWRSQVRAMWGVTIQTIATTSSPTSSPTTNSVTFNPNGGSGVMPVETESIGNATPLTINAFTRPGYYFSGWNTLPNGLGLEYSDGAAYSFVSSVTLYAQWTSASVAPPSTPYFSSDNWAGYVLPTSTPTTLVSGEWTVPTLNCTATPNAYSTTWVGMGGATWSSQSNSGPLLQTGVLYSCTDGVQSQDGWFELTPTLSNSMQEFVNFPIAPGDTIRAAVFQSPTTGQWSTTLTDLNTGLEAVFTVGQEWGVYNVATGVAVGSISTTTPLSYPGGTSVEWVQEDVSLTSGWLTSLADFNSVTFTHLETGLANWSLASGNEWEMTNSQGSVIAIPTAVVNSSFTVSYASS
jgi:hypothetical protein